MIDFYASSDLKNNTEMKCSNTGENLTSHQYSCDMGEFGFEEVFYFGIGLDLDMTHKCTSDYGKG